MAGILLDTGALYAIADRDDRWHKAMVRAVETRLVDRIIPVSVLTEACYLIGTHLGPVAERRLIRATIDGELLLEGLSLRDLDRVEDVLKKYADANIGFVDATIVAIAERLKVRTVVTTDRHHFRLFRPRHCRAFDLLP